MSKGLVDQTTLKLPKGITLKTRGTTGLRVSHLLSHGSEKVIPYIANQAKNYGEYIPEKWDCEDFCFLAASDVRYAFQGTPVGVVLGSKKVKGKDEDHAVIVLWFEKDINGKKEWEYIYYDPTFPKGNPVTDFTPYVVIPIPPSGSLNHYEYPPFEDFKFLEDAAFELDEIDSYKFDLIDAAKETLIKWKDEGYPGEGRFIDSTYYSYNDQVFRWFSLIRKEQKGAPIGAALGRYNEAEYGALIIWKSIRQFKYWDIFEGVEFAEEDYPDFKPRVVLV